MNGIYWFFLLFIFFIVFLLSLIRCLGDMGSSGFRKWKRWNKNLLQFALCSSYDGLIAALCPVCLLFWTQLHHTKCCRDMGFFLLLLLFLILLLLLLPSSPTATDAISLINHTTWPAVVTLPSFSLIPPMFWHFLLYQVSFPEIFEEFILNFFHKGKTRLLIKAIFPIKGLF